MVNALGLKSAWDGNFQRLVTSGMGTTSSLSNPRDVLARRIKIQVGSGFADWVIER